MAGLKAATPEVGPWLAHQERSQIPEGDFGLRARPVGEGGERGLTNGRRPHAAIKAWKRGSSRSEARSISTRARAAVSFGNSFATRSRDSSARARSPRSA